MLGIRTARIVYVHEDSIERDDLGYVRRYAGRVEVKDETGETHYFVNGSINQVKVKDRVVGATGTVQFERGGSYALWRFIPNRS